MILVCSATFILWDTLRTMKRAWPQGRCRWEGRVVTLTGTVAAPDTAPQGQLRTGWLRTHCRTAGPLMSLFLRERVAGKSLDDSRFDATAWLSAKAPALHPPLLYTLGIFMKTVLTSTSQASKGASRMHGAHRPHSEHCFIASQAAVPGNTIFTVWGPFMDHFTVM